MKEITSEMSRYLNTGSTGPNISSWRAQPGHLSAGLKYVCAEDFTALCMNEYLYVWYICMHACMYVCMNDHNLLHTFIYRHPYTCENSPGRRTSLRCRLGRHRALPLRRRSMTVCTSVSSTKKYKYLVVLCLMEMSTYFAI